MLDSPILDSPRPRKLARTPWHERSATFRAAVLAFGGLLVFAVWFAALHEPAPRIAPVQAQSSGLDAIEAGEALRLMARAMDDGVAVTGISDLPDGTRFAAPRNRPAHLLAYLDCGDVGMRNDVTVALYESTLAEVCARCVEDPETVLAKITAARDALKKGGISLSHWRLLLGLWFVLPERGKSSVVSALVGYANARFAGRTHDESFGAVCVTLASCDEASARAKSFAASLSAIADRSASR